MRDVTEALRTFAVPADNALTVQQRSGTVCVWCPRTLDGGEGVDLGGAGDWRPHACPACHKIQSRALTTYLDWYDHGVTCMRCPLRPCERGRALAAEHLTAREQSGKPPLWCVHCRTSIQPGEQARPHLWQGLSGPVYSYLHARSCMR
ncbi:hypothetical protein [Streptomyces sp. NPDC059063]|uniref:hypothetical protein n=1 Tax=unclassified Streptomyces TaxID=2593676 RepID=UPI003694DD47